MNPIFSRTLKALCVMFAVVLLTACGGASSTIDAFRPTRVIAFGDGFSYVDANGYGLSTVRTNQVDNTIAGRIAARAGVVVKAIASNPLAATGGFSYASPKARVADVNDQITAFLADAGNVVAKKDLIIITVGNWDIYDAVMTGASVDTASTNLVAGVKRLTDAGAEHVVVMPAINMARTPWALTAPNGMSLADIQKLTITTESAKSLTAFNFLLLGKLNDVYKQDKKPVYLLDRSGDFNSFSGKFDINGTTRILNVSGMSITADTGLYVPVCPAATTRVSTDVTFAEGCALPSTTEYFTYVFADDINLTPAANRYLGDRMIALLLNYGWLP
jgi:outer membrane lipase/esterase